MATCSILVKGYAKYISKNIWTASCNVVLIESNDQNILFDPGLEKEILFSKLKERQLSPTDITSVFISHRHIDHCFLMGYFEKARLYTGDIMIQNKKEYKHKSVITNDVTIFKTPGHTDDHASLLVRTKEGNVLVAGDLFWYEDSEAQIDIKSLLKRKDSFAKDHDILEQSRNKMLGLSNWIIPGHGELIEIS